MFYQTYIYFKICVFIYNFFYHYFFIPPPLSLPVTLLTFPLTWASSMLLTPLVVPSSIQACLECMGFDLGNYISLEIVQILLGLTMSDLRTCAHCVGKISWGTGTMVDVVFRNTPPQPHL